MTGLSGRCTRLNGLLFAFFMAGGRSWRGRFFLAVKAVQTTRTAVHCRQAFEQNYASLRIVENVLLQTRHTLDLWRCCLRRQGA
jgi:hypothetical protein